MQPPPATLRCDTLCHAVLLAPDWLCAAARRRRRLWGRSEGRHRSVGRSSARLLHGAGCGRCHGPNWCSWHSRYRRCADILCVAWGGRTACCTLFGSVLRLFAVGTLRAAVGRVAVQRPWGKRGSWDLCVACCDSAHAGQPSAWRWCVRVQAPLGKMERRATRATPAPRETPAPQARLALLVRHLLLLRCLALGCGCGCIGGAADWCDCAVCMATVHVPCRPLRPGNMGAWGWGGRSPQRCWCIDQVRRVRPALKATRARRATPVRALRSRICTSSPKRHTDTAQAPHASHGGLWRTTRGGSECAEALPCFGGISRPRGIALCVSGL